MKESLIFISSHILVSEQLGVRGRLQANVAAHHLLDWQHRWLSSLGLHQWFVSTWFQIPIFLHTPQIGFIKLFSPALAESQLCCWPTQFMCLPERPPWWRLTLLLFLSAGENKLNFSWFPLQGKFFSRPLFYQFLFSFSSSFYFEWIRRFLVGCAHHTVSHLPYLIGSVPSYFSFAFSFFHLALPIWFTYFFTGPPFWFSHCCFLSTCFSPFKYSIICNLWVFQSS